MLNSHSDENSYGENRRENVKSLVTTGGMGTLHLVELVNLASSAPSAVSETQTNRQPKHKIQY